MKLWQLCAILQPLWMIASVTVGTNLPGPSILSFVMVVIVTLCGIFSFKAEPKP